MNNLNQPESPKTEIKKKTFREKLRTNPWMVGTFVLGIFCMILISYNVIEVKKEMDNLISPEILCSKINVTPSWASWDGEIIGIGLRPFGNQSKSFVDKLIEQKIYLIYHSDCEACEKQIEEFGTEWERYIKSKLTVDCKELK